MHKTDHSVTAYFPAHYRQQVLMGACNEGPCLGQVMGEYSPNSYASIFRSISPSHPPFSQTFPLLPVLYATVHPQRLVILSVYLFLLSVMLPLPSSTAPPIYLHFLLFLALAPVTLFVSSSHDSQLIFCLFDFATSTTDLTCVSCSPFSFLFFSPFAPPGNNLKQRRPQDAG